MAVRTAANVDPDGRWRAGAILAQRLPEIGGEGEVTDSEAAAEAWNRALAFVGSVRRRGTQLKRDPFLEER